MDEEDIDVSWEDSSLDEVLRRIHIASKLLAPETILYTNDINTLFGNNAKKLSVLVDFDVKRGSIRINEVYETPKPNGFELAVDSDNRTEEGEQPALFKNQDFEMYNINARSMSLRDSHDRKKPPILGIDIRTRAQFDKVASLTLREKNNVSNIKKIISNQYYIDQNKSGFSFFFATDDEGKEGYLITGDALPKHEMSLEELLDTSQSDKKTERLKSCTINDGARLYAIHKGGLEKLHIPPSSEKYRTLIKPLIDIRDWLVKTPVEYSLSAAEVFVDGARADFNHFMAKVLEKMKEHARKYISSARPKLNGLRVEYRSPLSRGDISEDIDVFLEKVKVLYNDEKDSARKCIFSGLPESSSNLSMYQ